MKNKELINKSSYKSIKSGGSRPGILYGLGKIHKKTRNGLSPFRPILSAIGKPTYKLGNFTLQFLTPSTTNEYTVIDSFHFPEEICEQDPNLYVASLNVDSLFINIPLDGTIVFVLTTCTMATRIPLTSPSMTFVICYFLKSFFMFINRYYKQVNGIAMVSPVGSSFLCVVLKVEDFEIVVMISNLCFMDVMLMTYLHCSPDHAEKFKEYLSSKHPKIIFL